jgi:hypothetical protein
MVTAKARDVKGEFRARPFSSPAASRGARGFRRSPRPSPSGDAPRRDSQLRVEQRSACRPPDEVVDQEGESDVQHRVRAEPAEGYGHSPAAAGIERRLGPIRVAVEKDRTRGRRGQFEGGERGERQKGVGDIGKGSARGELDDRGRRRRTGVARREDRASR